MWPSRSARLRCALLTALLLPVTGVRAYEPRINFQLQCMGCHHRDGNGEPGRVPSVRATLVPFSLSADGRDFVMRVPGVSQSPLDDAQIAALLNWMVRNLSDVPVPDAFVDYTAEEVGRVRHQPLVGVAAARTRLLEQVTAR